MKSKSIILKQSFPFNVAKVERLFNIRKYIQRNTFFLKRKVVWHKKALACISRSGLY